MVACAFGKCDQRFSLEDWEHLLVVDQVATVSLLFQICLLVQTYSSPLTIQRSNIMRSGRLVLCMSKTCCCILLLALIAPFKFPPIALKEEKAQKLTSKTMYVQDCFVSCNKEEKKRLDVIKTMYVHSVSLTVNVYVLYPYCLIIWG